MWDLKIQLADQRVRSDRRDLRTGGAGSSGRVDSQEELLYAQQAALLRAGGQTEAFIAGNDHISRVAFEVIRQTDDRAEAKLLLDQGIERLRADLSEAERAAVDAVLAGIAESQWDAQLATMLTPWFRYLLDYDPAIVLRKVSVPVRRSLRSERTR